MSPRSRRRTAHRTAHRTAQRSARRAARRAARQVAGPASHHGGAPGIPRQRSAADPGEQLLLAPVEDAALEVLDRVVEDPDGRTFLAQLPLVRLVEQFVGWVGDGVAVPSGDDDDDDSDSGSGSDSDDSGAGPAEAGLDLHRRLGVEPVGSTGVERWRSGVLALACLHAGLVVPTDEGFAPGPNLPLWAGDDDPVQQARLRALVAEAALQLAVREVAAQHLEGDHVRHALAVMVVSAGERRPWPLGLMSALRPGDLLAEHVDRVVLEHVRELRAWGLVADGGELRAAPGAEALLEAVAVGLREHPVPVPVPVP